MSNSSDILEDFMIVSSLKEKEGEGKSFKSEETNERVSSEQRMSSASQLPRLTKPLLEKSLTELKGSLTL